MSQRTAGGLPNHHSFLVGGLDRRPLLVSGDSKSCYVQIIQTLLQIQSKERVCRLQSKEDVREGRSAGRGDEGEEGKQMVLLRVLPQRSAHHAIHSHLY